MSVTATASSVDSTDLVAAIIDGVRQEHEKFDRLVDPVIQRLGPKLIEVLGRELKNSARFNEIPTVSHFVPRNRVEGWKQELNQLKETHWEEHTDQQVKRFIEKVIEFVKQAFAKKGATIEISSYCERFGAISVKLVSYPQGEQGEL